MDAAVWVPVAKGTMKSATAAAEPLEEPPGVCAVLWGLAVGPLLKVANSVVTVLPKIMPPALRIRAIETASVAG